MSHRRPAEESLLFDLPLERPPADAPRPAPGGEAEQPPLPLAPRPEESEEAAPEEEPLGRELVVPDSHAAEAEPERRPGGPPGRPSLGRRAGAGLADLGVCAAVLVVVLVLLLAQGVRPQLSDWPAAALFLLSFSFLYSVLPMAFWGRTPGMALSGLRAVGTDGRPLTFRQAVLSWLGGVLTVAAAGLPLLLALGGRSLSNLVSGSVTRRIEPRR